MEINYSKQAIKFLQKQTNPECKTFVSADEAMKELGLN